MEKIEIYKRQYSWERNGKMATIYNPRDPHDMAAAQREYDEIAEDFVNEDFKEYSEEKLDVECHECGAMTINYKCTHCQQRGI